MGRFGSRTVRFLTELRRRQVLRVLGFYAITVWVILQIAADTFTPLGIPDGVHTALIVALVLGFPVVTILAWIFDITPQGLIRTAPAEHEARLNEFGEAITERPRLWIDALIITVLLGMIAYLLMPDTSTRVPTERSASIAVLPFVNLSADPTDAFLGDAISEDLIHYLAQIVSLKVASRTSSWAFRNRASDITMIAKTLNVDNVLEGSVQRDEEMLKVTLQLIRGDDGYHIWSRSFTTPFDNVFEVKREIARLTVDSLGLPMSDQVERAISRSPTEDIDAYELYLRGIEYLQRPHTGDTLKTAINLFERSLDHDSRFADAHAGLCVSKMYLYAESRSTSDFESGEKSCHRALTLGSRSPNVLVALGHLYRRSGQYDRAEDNFKESLELQASADARLGLAWVYSATDRDEEAIVQFKSALAEFPGDWRIHHQFGLFRYLNMEYTEAIKHFEWEVGLTPDSALGYQSLGAAQYMIGELDSALRNMERSVAIAPDSYNYSTIGLYRWYLGDFSGSADAYRAALNLAPEEFRNWCRLASVLDHAGIEGDEMESAYATGLHLASKELEINPNDPDVHKHLALCLAGSGNIEEALSRIETAVDIAENSASVNYFAAKVFLAAHDATRGLEHLIRALDLGYSLEIVRRDPALRALLPDDHLSMVIEQFDPDRT